MQQQKTSLRRDSHADLIRDLETAAAFETFFGEKYLNVTKQFRTVASRAVCEKIQRDAESTSAILAGTAAIAGDVASAA